MQATATLYSLRLNDIRTYIAAAIFVIGNIALPQLCHLIPQGGPIFLPIYFFTLIGAYKYGLSVGLLTATLSPVVNSLLFGMPAAAVLPAILLKSILLAVIAAIVAHKVGKASILSLIAVVLGYQVLGTLGEWALSGSLATALQDFRIAIPGLLIQVFGGFLLTKHLKP